MPEWITIGMMDGSTYDLAVIGGGPAGYAAAIRAGQLGKRVVCIESERAGGTCLNWGCIPSKALLKAAELYQSMQKAETFGIQCGELGFDFSKVMQYSREVSNRMAGGIEFLFKKNKVDYIHGKGRIVDIGKIEIIDCSGEAISLFSDNILIATGCKARRLPGLAVDGDRVMTSREALSMTAMPKSITIVGAGAIGVEFAYFLNVFGCQVTLVEMLSQIVPVEDSDVSKILTRSFKKQRIKIHTETVVENIQVGEQSVKMDLVKGERRTSHESESVLLAIGVEANTSGLFSNDLSLELDRGFIKIDDNYKTSMQGVFAAGDITGPPWLAHIATFEGVQAVNGMFGHSKPDRLKHFPGCTYCQPQVASVGLTEEQVKDRGLDYRIGRFPFQASGKAVAAAQPEGFVKLIIDASHGEILGAHIIGADATELIQEYNLAMGCCITAEKIHKSIHAHPTLSEALGEAAAAAFGEAIHL